MATVMVVIVLPIADDDASLGQRPEAVDVEAFSDGLEPLAEV